MEQVAHRGPDRRGSGPGRGARPGTDARSGTDARDTRRRSRHDAPAVGPLPFVARPFEGLAGEEEWVALREFVPAATATVALRAPGPDADPDAGTPADGAAGTAVVHVASVLPLARPAVVRADGTVWLGVQTAAAGTSGDASRELADTLARALDARPGSDVAPPERLVPGPRLQDLLDPSVALHLTVHHDFRFWFGGEPDGPAAGVGVGADEDDETVRASLDRTTQSLVPTDRILESVSAYRTEVGRRTYVRWVLAGPETAALDALARLHAGSRVGMGPGSRLLGSFRACGLLVPVWEVPSGTGVAELTEPVTRIAADLEDARALSAPLGEAERRSRAGLLSRQVTIH